MNAPTTEWQIAYASVRGKSHFDSGLPNQDALHLAVSPDQSCFSLTLSDGAGSARYAEEGSRHFARAIGDKLLELVHGASDLRSRNQIGDRVLCIITSARQALDPSGTQLRDYASNLMAVAMGPHWGLRVHLGDAVLLKSRFAARNDGFVDYFANTQMTEQDRSEYANETHFLTQPDWTKHLVWDFLDPNGPEDMFALMTDGAGDIALSNLPNGAGRRIFRGFFAPLIAQVLRAAPASRNQVIQEALSNPATYRLTGDDKTMALILRKRCWSYAGSAPVLSDTAPAPTTQTPSPSPPETSTSKERTTPAAPDTTQPLSTEPDATNVPALASHPTPAQLRYKKTDWIRWSSAGLALGLILDTAASSAYQLGRAHYLGLRASHAAQEQTELRPDSANNSAGLTPATAETPAPSAYTGEWP